MLGRMLTQFGFETSEAVNGKDALECLARDGRPDVLLLDWNMPELNGLDTLTAVRQNPALADLPIIMVTTETEVSQVRRAVEHGVSEYVMKPFTPDMLHGKLELLGLGPAG